MDKQRINTLADFFYSSDYSNEIPIRLTAMTGSYTGFDLSKEAFIELLIILNESKDLKKDLSELRRKYDG